MHLGVLEPESLAPQMAPAPVHELLVHVNPQVRALERPATQQASRTDPYAG